MLFSIYKLLTFIVRQMLGVSAKLDTLIEKVAQMADDQAKLDADVQALDAGIAAVEAEIAALKNVPPGTPIDFTGLDAAVAKLAADAPPTP